MNLILKLCFCLLYVSIIEAQTVSSCLKNYDNDYYCESENYPNNYLKGDCICEFSVPEGYQIAVTIQDLDLDSSQQDNIIITTGPEDKIYKFSWYLNNGTSKPLTFLIDKAYIKIIFHAEKDSEPDNKGFKIHLEQYGELTTTIAPTTENILPTPIANDSIYYSIYLDIYPSTLKKKEAIFKDFMLNITEQFIDKHKFEVMEPIKLDNIRIKFAKQCSVEWPNNEHCTEITYAIPILLNSSKYELNTKNLEKMWIEFGSKNLLHDTDWNEYKEPSNNYNMILWLILSLIILIAFMAFLFFIKVISFRCSTQFKRRSSDTDQIMANSNRNSDASLWPISSQIVPPLFDNESPYVYYEPDTVSSSVLSPQMQPVTKVIMNVDEMSDDEILTVPNRSGNNNFNQKPCLKLDDDDNNKESVL